MTRKTVRSIFLSLAFTVSLIAQNDELLFSPKALRKSILPYRTGKYYLGVPKKPYNFEAVLWSSNSADPVNGYPKYIDVESFIDWTILHEQSKGPDNLFHASTFASKERNKKLNMNAPWDFDLSYANTGNNPIEVPVYSLKPGIYILRLLTENNSVSKKIIVKGF